MEDAAARYEQLRPGLGLRFINLINKKTNEISDEAVEIIAVAHLKKRARYWRNR